MILKETMRELQAKAAENRIKENEARGLKDPEHVKRMQAKKKELEERQEHAAMEHGGGGGLKVSALLLIVKIGF